ncbi:condensation domain-containing protein, partial [Streptomyces sp. NPDC004311]|uniref:condensation domain-containing protein n=1 Tax=Streptomyces sp. NPDC004311 TaxID=3364698 RepID=UPI0036CE676B
LSIQVVARARRVGVRITPRQLFEHPTIARLARQAETFHQDDTEPSEEGYGVDPALAPADVLTRWQQRSGPLHAVWPMSALQQGMLYHALAEPGSEVYVEQLVCTLHGSVDPEVLLTSWQAAIARHPALRAHCSWQDVPSPVLVVPRRADVPASHHDWTREDTASGPDGTPADRLDRFLAEDRTAGFDLDGGPLVRLTLLRTAEDRWTFVWTHHHLLIDGWSLPIVAGEAFARYEAALAGRDLDLPPAADYGTFVRWSTGRDRSADEAFWRRHLGDFTEPALLAPAAVAPTGAADPVRHEPTLHIGTERAGALRRFARERGITLAALVHAAWALVVSRRTGAQDLTVGTVLSGRPAEIDGIEQTVGLFVNTLPLRVRTTGEQTADDWLRRVHQDLQDLADHQHTPLADVAGWAATPVGAQLFDSIVVVENYPFEGLRTAGFELVDAALLERTNYPVSLQVLPGEQLSLRVCADAAAFDADAARQFTEDVDHALDLLTADPAAPLRDLVADVRETPHRWSGTAGTDHGNRPVFVSVVERGVVAPSGVALVDGVGSWSFGELVRASGVLAAELRRRGVGAESVVGLCLPRGAAMVVGMLAVSRAGGAWLALDPGYPGGRLRLMAEDAGCGVVVCGGGVGSGVLGAVLPEGAVVLDLDGLDLAGPYDAEGLDLAEPGDLAYVVFTSGSTGRPKGVAITHGQLAGHLGRVASAFGLTDRDRVLVFGSFSFDVTTEQVLAPLSVGAAAVVRPDDVLGPEDLLTFLDHHRVSVFNPPTGLWRQLAGALAGGTEVPAGLAVRLTVVGGDAMPAAEVGTWTRAVGGRLLNAYGPSEAVITATLHEAVADEVGADGVVPIGRPLPGRTVHVLDGGLRGVAVGVVGELFVGGAGVGRGY